MNALILMTRIPYRGYTKTRMMPDISALDCEKLHNCFLRDYFSCFDKLSETIDIFISYAPEKFSKDFLKALPAQYQTFPQEGVNIGSRMLKAFERLFDQGYEKVVLVGCDIPQIQQSTYENAYKNLERVDMVISPTDDGGYCLIGLKKNYEPLFINDVSWGEESVIDSTLKTAKEIGLKVSVLDQYRDIDNYEDLLSLQDVYRYSDRFYDNIPLNTLMFINEINEEKVI